MKQSILVVMVALAQCQEDLYDYQDTTGLQGDTESLWREEAVFLTPQDRENTRVERDGGGFHGHGGGHGGGRQQRQQQAPRRRPQEVQVQVQDERRGGRQSGGVGLALGILNNPTDADGNYNFNFSDDEHGMSREETGAPGEVSGGYTYISPEGEQVSVQYHADEFGFHPTGSHIPQPPPMPPHVRRLLDHLAKVNGLPSL